MQSVVCASAGICLGAILFRLWETRYCPTVSLLERICQASSQQEIRDLYLQLLLESGSETTVCLFDKACIRSLCGYAVDCNTSNAALLRIRTVVQTTQCIFARQAALWGSCNDWETSQTAKANTLRSFVLFATAAHSVDGFVFEVSTGSEHPTLPDHGRAVASLVRWLRYHFAISLLAGNLH